MFLLVAGMDGMLKNDGFAIAITGMVIVFSALVLISLALTGLPKALAILNEYYPEKPDHSVPAPRPAAAPGSGDQELAAAAAFAMHLHQSGSN
ncbi:MAG: OadG family protein [Planctomycetes bacterium]|nr:OadG family protein [Planctomycetota bacterium]